MSNYRNFQKRNETGFTLIEIMIAVAIVGLLMLIALPAYNEQAAKARRIDAATALIGLAVAMERFYTEQTPSTYVGATVGASGIYPNTAPLDSADNFYELKITAQTSTAFTVTAEPIGNQVGDKCGTFTLTSVGGRTAASSDCWD